MKVLCLLGGGGRGGGWLVGEYSGKGLPFYSQGSVTQNVTSEHTIFGAVFEKNPAWPLSWSVRAR